MDSGRAPGDREARASQVEQLLDTLQRRSPGRAVIVAGDFNMGAYDEALADQLLSRGGLSDACASVACETPHNIDRVMYRGSDTLHLEVLRVSIDHRFVRDDGQGLSDHEPVAVHLRWELRRPEPPGGPQPTASLKLE
jgi:endonuclease/exonuclease/phosphatase family metal-dependent hydrolase